MTRLVPLSELEDVEFGAVHWKVNLPEYAPTDKIGVNVGALGQLARLGGFRHLDIVSYAGEVDKVAVDPGHANTDGSLTGVAIAQREKTSAPRHYTDEIDGGPGVQFYSSGLMRVNTSPMADQISQKGKLRDAGAWSSVLDHTLRANLRKITAQNLAGGDRRIGFIGLSTAYGAVPTLMHQYYDSAGALSWLPVASAAAIASAAVIGKFEGARLSDIRFSAVYGVQLDRIAAVYGGSAVRRLVKPL